MEAAGVEPFKLLILRKLLVRQEVTSAKRVVCRVGGTKTVQTKLGCYRPSDAARAQASSPQWHPTG